MHAPPVICTLESFSAVRSWGHGRTAPGNASAGFSEPMTQMHDALFSSSDASNNFERGQPYSLPDAVFVNSRMHQRCWYVRRKNSPSDGTNEALVISLPIELTDTTSNFGLALNTTTSADWFTA